MQCSPVPRPALAKRAHGQLAERDVGRMVMNAEVIRDGHVHQHRSTRIHHVDPVECCTHHGAFASTGQAARPTAVPPCHTRRTAKQPDVDCAACRTRHSRRCELHPDEHLGQIPEPRGIHGIRGRSVHLLLGGRTRQVSESTGPVKFSALRAGIDAGVQGR